MTTDFPTAPSAYGLNGPSAAVTVEKSPHASHTKILTPPAGNINRLARDSSVPVREVESFLEGPRGLISFQTLINIGMATRLSPLSILTGELKSIQLPQPEKRVRNLRPVVYRGTLPPDVIEQEVRAIAADSKKPCRITSIERRLGLNRGALRSICPDLYAELNTRHLDAVRQKNKTKELMLTEQCHEVIEVLKVRGIEPTLVNAGTVTHDAWYPKDWRSRLFLKMSSQ